MNGQRHPATADIWAWLDNHTGTEMPLDRYVRIASKLVELDRALHDLDDPSSVCGNETAGGEQFGGARGASSKAGEA